MQKTETERKNEAIRDLQASPGIIKANHAKMQDWGAYNLLKVRSLVGEPAPDFLATGYITVLAAVSGLTPEEMVKVLGLRSGTDLIGGAAIYQLSTVPGEDEFHVRGYTTLPDGLRLEPGAATDAFGYGPGHGAWQVCLKGEHPAKLFAVVHPGKRFEPPLHPRVAAMYGR